jgi:hypothetical protein
MSSVPFPADPGPYEAELASLYARLAAINRVIADLEKYEALAAKTTSARAFSRAIPVITRKAG